MKKYLGKIFMSSAILAGVSLSADLPEPYASNHFMPHTPYYVQDSYVFYNLAQSHNCAVIIDVESEDGGVARYLAQQANSLPALQKIYSVNIWQSNDRSQKHLFRRFLSNVAQEETTQWIVPIRMSSLEASDSLYVKADLISLVGANDRDTIYNDIIGWFSRLSDHGVMCGNNWYEPSVQIGVTKAAMMLDVSLQVNNNVWYFVKG